MALQHCSESDLKIIGSCLAAVLNSPLFPEWEFSILIGLEREDVAKILRLWPDADATDKTIGLAVNNVLVNLIGYPHGEDLARLVSATPGQLSGILKRWQKP